MLIELVGLPGSGKTTFSKAFAQHLNASGLSVTNAQTLSADITQKKRTPRFVKAKKERALLHRYVRFQRRNPKLDALAVAQYDDKPIRHLLFAMMAASYQGVRDLENPDDIVLMDEGFLAHGIATFFETNNTRALTRFIKLAPLVDMVMFADAPAAVAFERATERVGGGTSQRNAAVQKHGDLPMFQQRETMLRAALKTYTERGVPLIQLDTVQETPEALAVQAFDAMQALKP